MFKQPIQGQVRNPTTGQYPQSAKVTDYDENKGLYKVRYEDNNTQWIDIEDPNVIFVSQHVCHHIYKIYFYCEFA